MRFSAVLILLWPFVALAADKPNVLMIVGDDWGWTDFGFAGHPDIRTPHLDRLAKEGALFANGYTPPPSRNCWQKQVACAMRAMATPYPIRARCSSR